MLDAEAIAEAVTRPTMRLVPVKSAERQAAPMDHKMRDVPVRQQTQTVSAIRAHLGEFGIVVAKGLHNVDRPLDAAREGPEAARPALDPLAGQLRDLRARIQAVTGRLEVAQAEDGPARRQPSRASAPSPPAPLQRPRQTSGSSALGGTRRRGSALPPDPTPAAARNGSAASQRPATARFTPFARSGSHGTDPRPAPRATWGRSARPSSRPQARQDRGGGLGHPHGPDRLGSDPHRREPPPRPRVRQQQDHASQRAGPRR